MFLSGIEQVAYDNGRTNGLKEGRTIGLEEGLTKGREEQAKESYDRLIKAGFSEEQAHKYVYGNN